MRLNYRFYVEAIEGYIDSLEPRYLAHELLRSAIEAKNIGVLNTVQSGGYSTYRTGSRNVSPRITKLYSSPDKKIDKEIHERSIKHFTTEIVPRIEEDKKDELLRRLLKGVRQDESVEEKDVKTKKKIRMLGKKCITEKEALGKFQNESLGEYLAETFIYAVLQEDRERLEKKQKASLATREVAIDSTDHAFSLMQHEFQEWQIQMLTSAYKADMIHKGITPETAQKYIESTYDGPRIDGKAHGEGSAEYPDGSVYAGDWEHNVRHGHGILTQINAANTIIITANWENDRPHDNEASLQFLSESLGNSEHIVRYVKGKLRGKGIWMIESVENTTFWRTNSDGSVHLLLSHNGLHPTFDFAPDGKMTIKLEITEEGVHTKTEFQGYHCYTDTRIYLRNASRSIEYDDGTIEFCQGNLSLPNLELFGSGELTIEGTWGKHHYFGNFRNDELNGYAAEIREDGFRYEGFFVNDERHGWGRLTIPCESGDSIYVGQWIRGKRHGRGKATYDDGSSYIGQWRYGHYCGRGKKIFSDQSSYEGEWKNSRFHGRGARIYEDGSYYVGQWKKGKPHGLGTETDAGGKTTYVGVWRQGRICGWGTHYRSDGTKSYVGEAKDGIPHGRGQELDESESIIYEGEFQNGLYHGRGTKWYPDKKYIGQWEQGYQQGRGKGIGPQGTYTGEWQKGKPHGKGSFEAIDGSWRHIGEWVCSKAHGLGIRIKTDGTEQKGLFEHGEYIGDVKPSHYYGDSIDGIPHGYGEYLNSSFDHYKGFWKMGQCHGTGIRTYPNGMVLQAEWADGNLISPCSVRLLLEDGSSYEGEMISGIVPHGLGKHIAADGTIRDGEWDNGSFTGKGVVTYASGGVTFGNWLDNKLNGFAVVIDPDGKVWKGNWHDDMLDSDDFFWVIQPSSSAYFGAPVNGLQCGKDKRIEPDSWTVSGVLSGESHILNGNIGAVFPDGEIYQGVVLNGKFNGQGKRVIADGAVLDGIWENGAFTGNGDCYVEIPCNHIYLGQMSDGVRNGRGTLIHLNGNDPFIEKGVWENDVLSGEGECVLSNGTTYRGLFRDGVPFGRGKVTIFDGRKGEGEFCEDGKLCLYAQPMEIETSA